MSEQCAIVKIKKYEYVPPDGGWAYVICFAAAVIFSCLMMFMSCFGLIFNDFLKQMEMGSTSVTLLWGVNAVCVALAGFLTGPLLKIMSLRQLAFLATLLYNAGIFGTIFVNSKVMFFFCQGLLQNTGTGILFNVTLTFVNDYFLKKRFFAMSLVQATSALATMLAPLLVKWSLTELGFRGTLVLISAVSMQTFIAVALLEPVERHMKKVEVDNADEMKLLLLKNNPYQKVVTTPVVTLSNVEKSFDSKIDAKIEEFKTSNKNIGEQGKILAKINQVIDVILLKRFCLSNASLGMTFCVFGDAVFLIMLPQALYAMRCTDDKVALAMSLLFLGDLMTRISFIFLSKWLVRIGNQELFIVGLLIAVATRLGMLWTADLTLMLIYITVMGVGRCTNMVLPPLILAEVFEPDKFTSAIGLFMMMYGAVNIVLGPAIGAVRDLTNSYPTAFYILTSIFGAVALLWSIELFYKKNKHKRISQKEAADRTVGKSNKSTGK